MSHQALAELKDYDTYNHLQNKHKSMKNIEKIAIDTILENFQSKNAELISGAISAKGAVELAQANFKKAAGPLVNYAKDSASILLQDDVSEEAIAYFEARMSDLIKIPFKAKG
jgi:hypothetical protein